MSITGIEAVLSKAMSEAAFAEQLFANPEKALTGYDLTQEEAERLSAMSRAEFDKLIVAPLEERLSLAGVGFINDPPSGKNHNQTALKFG